MNIPLTQKRQARMVTIHVLVFIISITCVGSRYSLYHSYMRQTSYPTFDCLYAYMVDAGKEIGLRYVRNYHLIPYCRRPDSDDEQVTDVINKNIAQTITFDELKKQGVTSEQLLTWFAPIDVAERYEMNSTGSDVFHNCSLPWFGSMCQYKFDYDLSLSFGDIVEATFSRYSEANISISTGTCYRFLNSCNQELWPLCLDWREICDGKNDCMSGEDEQGCGLLEITECTDDEYRCHYGGQCIPLIFAKDSRLSIDCLDGSDEIDLSIAYTTLMNTYCSDVSTFRCQERIGRYPASFQCGDGQYWSDFNLPSRITFCSNKRDIEFSRAVLTSLDYIADIGCREAFYCALYCNRTQNTGQPTIADKMPLAPIVDKTWDEDCKPLSQHCSTEWVVIPQHPTMFGFFQFVYFTNRSVEEFKKIFAPDFICFNGQKCPALLATITTVEIVHGLSCCNTSDLVDGAEYLKFDQVLSGVSYMGFYCRTTNITKSCPNSSDFHCPVSSKCISRHRVGDGIMDCYYNEDELSDVCQSNGSNRFICESDPNKCLLPVALGNGHENCPLGEDEVYTYARNLVELVPFSVLCNIQPNYWSLSINSTETDETNCDLWPCNNPYTGCNKYWDCSNGADELNCPDHQCSFNEYECLSELTELSYCLPIDHLYDKYRNNCSDPLAKRQIYFYNGTNNISDNYLSWSNSKCATSDELCLDSTYSSKSKEPIEICHHKYTQPKWMYEASVRLIHNSDTFCMFKLGIGDITVDTVFLSSTRLGYFPPMTINLSIPIIPGRNQEKKPIPKIDVNLVSQCHRGIAVLSGVNATKQCLCPPNYFGTKCEWQNQRVSLTLQLVYRSTVSTSVIFQVIIMMIDEHGQIGPNSEQITYMPSRDCDTKFNIYLLYPHRPKDLSHNYSIRIDLFEKVNLDYWSSWYFPITFPFLPVNRISTQLIIPEIPTTNSCSSSCGKHGKCMSYINDKSFYFCQCAEGYSGVRCEFEHKCACSSDSYCHSSSICVCPLYKFGSSCYLKHSICQSSHNPCQHNGLCVPNDDRIDLIGFSCFCSDDYSGARCENRNNRIDISLDHPIIKITSFVLIHFITAFKNAEHERTTVLKKIPFDQHILTLYVKQPFHILILQIPNEDYYLAIVRERFIPSEYISTEIQSHQRCLPLVEVMNGTLLNSEYLRRAKSYPFICRQDLKVMCFYDNDLMCICDVDRFSNCFLFNQTMNYDCQGHNHCENGGQCFQNNETCPTKSTCVCPDCYYGAKCQFVTKGFLFSLDPILGYHIKPNISLHRQPLIIKMSIFISTIMFISGLISGILSIIIFSRKKLRQVGSGNYLLVSSITSVCMITILTIKFWQLILSQMSLITNRSLLAFNCISIDFTLKILLASSEWLNACVAIERMTSVNRGFHFDRRKSKESVKYIIPIVFLLTTLTQIHDPIYRELIDDSDGDEQRIWCFVHYSPSIRIYNSFITIFHFLAPFSINLLTALRIIQKLTQRRSTIEPEQPYQERFQQQVHRHRHLLFAPCMLILLSLPRLIISFSRGCMRSAREPWLYLIGYFVSFVPSMLTFVVFVLPSDNYKNEFRAMYKQTLQRLRTTS